MKYAVAILLAMSLLLTACDDGGDTGVLPGYMEAELVLVGPEESGRIAILSVEEGGSVVEGSALFELEDKAQKANAAAAKGRLQEAEAALKLSRVSLDRAKDLRERGVAAQARLDDAQSGKDRNIASVAAARAAYDEAMVRLDKRKVFAPRAGSVEEVYFRAGEVVNPGQPVIAILPPGNLKVRFYVSEPIRASLRTGQRVGVSCDGCGADLKASISFIARDAEFTPPVIFSREERGKLVYLVEARPEGETAKLTAGQPVSVSLEAETEPR